MKYIKNIILSIAMLIYSQSIIAGNEYKPMGQAAVETGIKGIKEICAEYLPAAAAALAGFGYNFGLGTVTAIGAGITKTAVAAKAAAIAVVSAPAAPYVAAGGVAVYGGYKTYRYFYPTKEEINQEMEHKTTESENELKKCLKEKMTSERDHNGVPIACGEHACTHAIYAGAERTDKVVGDFARYAPSR